jgi:U3 small nucleolar RNA-associated protein 25
MSTAVQLKLLTLLNVSATKRPLDVDAPGAAAKFPIRRSNSLLNAEAASPSPAASSSSSPAPHGDTEPPRKRKKTVQWNGEIGPSGSGGGVVKGKGKEKVVKVVEPAKRGKLVDEEEEGQSEISLKQLAEAENDADDDDGEAANGTSGEYHFVLPSRDTPTPTQSPCPTASKDTFNVHFAVEPTILTTESIAAAESEEWRSSRRHLKGFGRVVEVKPGKGEVTGDDDARARVSTFRFSCLSQPTQCHFLAQVTPSLLQTFTAAHPSPSTTLSSSLDVFGQYKDFFVHGLDGDADGSGAGGFGKQTEDVRSAAVLHALNHVMK